MELKVQNLIDEKSSWEAAGVRLPSYDVQAVRDKSKDSPRWVHFGIGNIFRVFIAGIAEDLIEAGYLDRGITCVETFDYDVVDQIYDPFDNLIMSVILRSDGKEDLRVMGAAAEAVKARFPRSSEDEQSVPEAFRNRKRMKEIFSSQDLQLVSFTITEKGYALKDESGKWLPYIEADLENGPEYAGSAMAIVAAMLLTRYRCGRLPIAFVSMDNCSHNGSLLKKAVLTIAEEWSKRGFTDGGYLDYLLDESKVAFLWTMIDKITPRPSEGVKSELETLGIANMGPVITSKRTYIAPFVNAEGPQYLVIEDRFPNGRPALEHGKGVYLANRDTVNLAERMKVTACLNPVHSALGPIGVVAGIDLFADVLNVLELNKMGRMVAYGEGLPVVKDPGIISPKAFTDELFEDRFPNRYLGDTNLRLCTDVTQGMCVRFGETIKTYQAKNGSAESLLAIPLGIAGIFRYMMGIDDEGRTYELAPDPLADKMHEALSDVVIGEPDTLKDQLRPFLSNVSLFTTDLYEAGLGEKIEGFLREMVAGRGACMETVKKYMA